MSWAIELSTAAERDLEHLFYHLADRFVEFGSSRQEAAAQALDGVQHIRDSAERLADAPHRGATHDDLLPGSLHLTLEKAIYWFLVDEEKGRVGVLAIFYGGRRHQRKILLRLLS
jgi:toxin ParE1/3/4